MHNMFKYLIAGIITYLQSCFYLLLLWRRCGIFKSLRWRLYCLGWAVGESYAFLAGRSAWHHPDDQDM